MPQVRVSKAARADLISIRAYITDELINPDAAAHVLSELRKSILSLAEFVNRGNPLDALISVHTNYRYLVCENYCIFYLADEKEVIIVRILHQRQDCLRALFLK